MLDDHGGNATAPRAAEVLDELGTELDGVAGTIAASTEALTGRFMALARLAADQTANVEALLAQTNRIPVDGGEISVDEVVAGLGETLGDFARQVLMLSKHAVTMVHTIDGVLDDMHQLDGFVHEIDRITGKTNLLALNARIEAEKAGEAGKTFRVVAEEVRELSRSTATLSERIRERMAKVSGSLRNGHETLMKVAAMDFTTQLEAKENVDATLAGLIEQSAFLGRMAAASLDNAAQVRDAVSGIITDMQFEDRSNQNLARVAGAIRQTAQACRDLNPAALPDARGPALPGKADSESVEMF